MKKLLLTLIIVFLTIASGIFLYDMYILIGLWNFILFPIAWKFIESAANFIWAAIDKFIEDQ